ncbi:hypothetical protein QAD02_017550 [Eretmocerus hayati]|uniref:Uncharacterized protein n=1 Tax=Eretmocerus hayati TaxID=131215 RepID=A0ACC2PE73_9HYME|nr:hypothetical protein QAD02_017550 [Eretmocerus hayati]
MKGLLRDCGFDDLAPNFKEHRIDDLDDLGDFIASTHFEEVVPKIALRFKITRKYQAEMQMKSSHVKQGISPGKDPLNNPTIPKQNNPDLVLDPLNDESGDCQTQNDSDDPVLESENEAVPEQETTNEKRQAEVIVIESESSAKRRRYCRTQDFDLKKVLEKHPLGQCIIIQYNVFSYLEPIHQLYLVQIIALELLKVYGKDLTDAEIEVVAERIHVLMKSEPVAIYFVPAIPKNNLQIMKNSESAMELSVIEKNELETEKDPVKRKSLWDDSYVLRVEDRKNGEFIDGTYISSTWPNLKDEDAFDMVRQKYDIHNL